MKAMLLTGHGGPDKLKFATGRPAPEVADDEAIVMVGACGTNNTDI